MKIGTVLILVAGVGAGLLSWKLLRRRRRSRSFLDQTPIGMTRDEFVARRRTRLRIRHLVISLVWALVAAALAFALTSWQLP
jgi:hypothetical protein